MQECGKTILLYRNGSGEFNVQTALEFLIEKYGLDKAAAVFTVDDDEDDDEVQLVTTTGKADEETNADVTAPMAKKRKSVKKSKAEGEEGEEGGESAKKKAKVKKSETYVVEGNKAVGDAIYEMAGIYFKNNDARKGGVFSKGAKSIRECDFLIRSMKEAMSLSGIGKGMASYIQEYLDTGVIVKLEEMRAGMA
jgi:hypothetical protein